MSEKYYNKVEDAYNFIRERIKIKPELAIVLGSGMGSVADNLKIETKLHYSEIPNFPSSTVKGHSGNLLIGKYKNRNVAVMQGRIHFYEGYSMLEVTFPIRVLQLMGIKTLILTNAAGGINRSFKPGDIMLVTDHINMAGMTGKNPLRGKNDERFGIRFPDMSEAYDLHLRNMAIKVAKQIKITLRQGIYAYVSGPNFETPAEVNLLRIAGADAVGMSTVPEVLAARHGGIKVLAISGISNVLTAVKKTTYEEVLEAGKTIGPKITKIIDGVLETV